MEKQPHLSVVEGDKLIVPTYIDRFREAFASKLIKYYPAEQVGDGLKIWSGLLATYQVPEPFCRDESPVRQHWNDVIGQGLWALTPTVDGRGEVVHGFVDIVSVPSGRPTVEEVIGSVSTHIVQGEGPPPLRPIQD